MVEVLKKKMMPMACTENLEIIHDKETETGVEPNRTRRS